MAIEIVDFPSYKMVVFHSYVTVYQRVMWKTKNFTSSQSYTQVHKPLLGIDDFGFPHYPLVNCYITMENHHFIAGKIHDFYGHFQ